MPQYTALQEIKSILERDQQRSSDYTIPQRWMASGKHDPTLLRVNPYEFFLDRITWIESHPESLQAGSPANGGWSRFALTYNLFVRLATAWDHNTNGRLDLPCTDTGWRETGTFLKSIALLPYIKSLGCNTVHLLPIMAIGRQGRKGTLGSPYAVQTPFALDEFLAEPALGVGAETEFKAFVEAAHHLGIRVVLEFAMRTMAIDSTWIAEHPEWFYWIRANISDRPIDSDDESLYGQPIFTPEEQRLIEIKVTGDLHDLLPPHEIHRQMFTPPPLPNTIHKDQAGRWIGRLADGTPVRVPGAFTDWPLVANQSPWSDVTYLRLFDHPEYNYLAYNTIRTFDTRLNQPQNRVYSLWKYLSSVIPYYQQTFGIDGAMIDLGHCLPRELKHQIVEAARQHDPDFAFWLEDFDWVVDELIDAYVPFDKIKRIDSDALMGPPFLHNLDGLERYIRFVNKMRQALPYIMTSENHNTPRTATRPGGVGMSRTAAAVSAILPGVLWVHNGFELAETQPVNPVVCADDTGCAPEDLPLFSGGVLNWRNEQHLIAWIAQAFQVRQRHIDLLSQLASTTLSSWQHGAVLILARHAPAEAPQVVLFVNRDMQHPGVLDARIPLPEYVSQLTDVFTEQTITIGSGGEVRLELGPGQCLLCEVQSRALSVTETPGMDSLIEEPATGHLE